MATEWFYEKEGESCGPVSSTELKSMANSGDISSHTLIWKEGLADWVSASTAKGLFSSSSEHKHQKTPLKTDNRTLLTIVFGTASVLSVLFCIALAMFFVLPYLTTYFPAPKPIGENVQNRAFAVNGSVGVFHTRQITVKDNWRISWVFDDCDYHDSISVWDGKNAVKDVKIKKSQRTNARPYTGSVEIPNGGTYIIQVISTEGNWTMRVSGEEPGAARNGIDIQFGDDKYMGGFLESGGMGGDL